MSTLILLRHGQSDWNEKNLFTGWVDVDLTIQGEKEAINAGKLLAAEGLYPDVVHTSVLRRAIRTAHFTLEACDRLWIPEYKHWRLNERHYGSLQGLNKVESVKEFGEEPVLLWRRSYDTPPPRLDPESPMAPSKDIRYREIDSSLLPLSECLADVVDRTMPYFDTAIADHLREGKTVLVAAHGNSLRAIVKMLERISDDDIAGLEIPTGVPRVYALDEALAVISVRELGDAEANAAARERVANQIRQ